MGARVGVVQGRRGWGPCGGRWGGGGSGTSMEAPEYLARRVSVTTSPSADQMGRGLLFVVQVSPQPGGALPGPLCRVTALEAGGRRGALTWRTVGETPPPGPVASALLAECIGRR